MIHIDDILSRLMGHDHRLDHYPVEAGDLIHWTQDISVGNALIDAEHREIIRLLNMLYQDWASGAHNLDIHKMLGLMTQVLTRHVANEEQLMARHHCPTLAQHRDAHLALLTELNGIGENGRDWDTVRQEQALLRFARDVVMDHIITWDMMAAPYLH